jgi:hypothetical protein
VAARHSPTRHPPVSNDMAPSTPSRPADGPIFEEHSHVPPHRRPGGGVPAATEQLRAWWGDRGVKTKVVAPVAVAAVVAGTIGVLGLQAMSATQDRINSLYSDVTVPVNDLGKIGTSLEQSNALLSEILLNTDPAALKQVQEDMAATDAALDERFAAFTSNDMTGVRRRATGSPQPWPSGARSATATSCRSHCRSTTARSSSRPARPWRPVRSTRRRRTSTT